MQHDRYNCSFQYTIPMEKYLSQSGYSDEQIGQLVDAYINSIAFNKLNRKGTKEDFNLTVESYDLDINLGFTVAILYEYHSGSAATYYDPPEPEWVELYTEQCDIDDIVLDIFDEAGAGNTIVYDENGIEMNLYDMLQNDISNIDKTPLDEEWLEEKILERIYREADCDDFDENAADEWRYNYG